MTEHAKPYTAERALQEARQAGLRAARVESSKYVNQAIADDERDLAATLREYAAMKEAMKEIAATPCTRRCADGDCDKDAIANRFTDEKEGV